jgi:hypothetical protein
MNTGELTLPRSGYQRYREQFLKTDMEDEDPERIMGVHVTVHMYRAEPALSLATLLLSRNNIRLRPEWVESPDSAELFMGKPVR